MPDTADAEQGSKTTVNRPLASSYWRFVPIGLIAVGIVVSYALGLQHYLSFQFLVESRDSLKAIVEANYVLAILCFLLAYTLVVTFSLPAASALTIFGGFLFGWMVAGAAVAVGATTGATLVFLAARSALGDFLRKRAKGIAARVARGFEKDAFSYLLVLRLAPIFPFFLINIVPALFNVSLRSYVAATFLGILPATFAYAYLGQGIDSVLLAAKRSGQEVSIADVVTPEIGIAFAALAVVAAIPIVITKVRRKTLPNDGA